MSLRERLPNPPLSVSLQARQATKRTLLGMFTGYYRNVFDAAPDGTEEPILGSVVDDLAGVYDDLSDGLVLYDNGYPLKAQHHWHVMYRLHWGLHATGDLVAIYFQGPWAKRRMQSTVNSTTADSKVKCNTCKPRKVSRCKHHPGTTNNSSPKTG